MKCLDPETLAELAEGRLPASRREAALAHLAGCDACRETALALVPEEASERLLPTARPRFPWAAAALAAASLLFAVTVVWKVWPRGGETPSQTSAVPEPAPQSRPPDPAPPPGPDPRPEPKPPDGMPRVPEPDPGPKPQPQPPAPDPEPPVKPPPPVDPPPPAPTRALAAVRVLDVTGKLFIEKDAVAEGFRTGSPISSPKGAGFHAEGRLFAFAPGAIATLGLDGDTVVLDVKKGEVMLRAHGGPVRTGQTVVEKDGWVVVTDTKVENLAAMTPAAAQKRTAKFSKLLPATRTFVFEDFAGEKDGFAKAAAQMGPIVGATVPVPAGLTWSADLRVRFRARTSAATVQIGARFRDRQEPWAAMLPRKGDGWHEFTVRASDFSAGPMGGGAPGADAALLELTFAVNTQEPGSAGASLDIDDVVLFQEVSR